MWKFLFLLFAIVGISVGSAKPPETKEDFTKLYKDFGNRQETIMKRYADSYHQNGLLTFEKVVRKYTIPKQEFSNDLSILENLPANANVDETDELARIGQKLKYQQVMMESVQNATMLNKQFKYQAVILMIQKKSSPIVNILKQTVIDLMTATSSEAQEKLHKHLYDYFGEKYEPFFLHIQAELDIVEAYYENPRLFTEKSIVKIDKLMNKFRDWMDNWKDNGVESRGDLDNLMELVPDFLQSLVDLKRELELAKVHCDLTRCTKHSVPQSVTVAPPESLLADQMAILVDRLEKLEHANDHAILDYNYYGYHTFEKLAKQCMLTAEQKELMETSKNRPFENHLQMKNAYDELKLLELKLSQVVNSTHLADSFKVAVLLDFVYQRPDGDFNQTKNDVMRIIDEENEIDRNFNKPSKNLEALYSQIEEKYNDIELTFTSEGYTLMGQNFQHYCEKKAENCDPELIQKLAKYFEIHKQIRAVFPLDTPEKIDNLLNAMKEFDKLDGVLNEAIRHHHLICRPSGCEKIQ